MDMKALQNKSNQNNPNHPSYWQCRGYSSRPKTFEEEINRKKNLGQLEHRANSVAATNTEQKKKMGRDNKRVEKVVKEVIGKDVMVYKGGSQLKRTNVASSDNDLKLKVPQSLKKEDKDRLGNALVKEFGKKNVQKDHSKIHVVRGEAGDIDIVPNQAEYFPPDFKFDGLGKNPFTSNATARHAVRNIKTEYRSVPGCKVESTVLKVQQQNRKIPLDELIEKTKKELKLN